MIRLVEKATGQPKLRKMYLDNQRFPRPNENFFQAAVRKLALDVRYNADALAAIPATGPVVVVANHPYGVLDGIVISWLISEVRPDFVVLTNAVLMRAPEVNGFVLPVDFSETEEARRTNIASRAAARASSTRAGWWWSFRPGRFRPRPTSSASSRRSTGAGSRSSPSSSSGRRRPWCRSGSRGRTAGCSRSPATSATRLRISLIFHEVRSRIGTALPVVIGAPIPYR